MSSAIIFEVISSFIVLEEVTKLGGLPAYYVSASWFIVLVGISLLTTVPVTTILVAIYSVLGVVFPVIRLEKVSPHTILGVVPPVTALGSVCLVIGLKKVFLNTVLSLVSCLVNVLEVSLQSLC